MAVTFGKSPVLMTATGDSLAAQSSHWKVTIIRCVTDGNAGEFVLFDALGGREILHTRALQANDSEESGALDYWVDGIYISSMPAGGQVYVYYE